MGGNNFDAISIIKIEISYIHMEKLGNENWSH